MADYRENAFEFYADDKRMTFSVTQGRLKTRIYNLAKQHPDECRILAENDDGSIYGYMPTKWLKIFPGHGRKLTEEEKEINRQRLLAARVKRSMSQTLESN